MKLYIKASNNNSTKYVIHDVMKALDSKTKKVYIEYGSLVDRLMGYTLIKSNDPVGEDTVIFNTTNATTYFGSKVDLTVFDYVDYSTEGNIMTVEVRP